MKKNIIKERDKIVCLCGSTKFKKEFELAIRELSLKGNIVLSVAQFSHFDNLNITIEEKNIFNALHFKKIDLSDFIYVINPNGYIGDSTNKEIEYAKNQNKIVYFMFENE